MKKVLALVLTFALVFSTLGMAFADTTTTGLSADATSCANLGMLVGDGNGVTTAYTATLPTRIQAAIMFLRLKGLEAEAKAFTGTVNFADANTAAWAAPIMAYLKAHPEYGWVGDGTNFNPNGALTAQDYYKVMLEALGYKQNTAEVIGDFTYAGTIAFAKTVGLEKVAAATPFTVDNLATATIEALKAVVKGGTKTLGTVLVEAGKLDMAKAVAAGVYSTASVVLAVESIKAPNLMEVNVTFNKAVDEDELDTDDFEVVGEDPVDDYTLSADGKTVTLQLADALTNDEEYEMNIDGVYDLDGKEITAVDSMKFTTNDETVPTVQKIEFVGPETIEITFSEPIDAAASTPEVSVDNGVYMGSVDENESYDWNVVTVELGTEMTKGDHVFKIKGFVDYAEYTMVAKTMTVAYTPVTAAPTVTVKEATQEDVTLTFSIPVKGIETTGFYHSYSTYQPLEIQDADGAVVDPDEYYSEITLIFTDAGRVAPLDDDSNDKPLPVGKTKIVVLTEGDNETIMDRWENELADDVTLYADITADTTAPTVTKVEGDEEEIDIYFSEGMNVADAEDEDNYVITNADGDVLDSYEYTADYDTEDDYVALVFDEAQDPGKFTVKISGLTDDSLSANKLATVTKEVVIGDSTAVNWDDVTVSMVSADRIIYVDYDSKMTQTGTYGVLNIDNYQLNGEELDSDTKLSMYDTTTVKILLPTDADPLVPGDGLLPDGVGDDLTIGRVADAEGNFPTDVFAMTYVDIPEVQGPVITEICKIDNNKFELTVDQDIRSIGADAIFTDNDGDNSWTKVAGASYVNDGDDTIIKITVNATETSDGTETPDVYAVRIVGDKIKSTFGVYNDAADYEVGGVEPADGFTDGMAPELATDVNDDDVVYALDADGDNSIDHIAIQYSEPIKANTVSKYTYKVSGWDVLSATTGNYASWAAVKAAIVTAAGTANGVNGEWVIINIEEDDVDDTDATPSVTQQSAVEDLSDNEYKEADAMEVIDWDHHL